VGADGTKYPPIVIFQSTSKDKVYTIERRHGCIITWQWKGWTDKQVLRIFYENVIDEHCGAEPGILFFDSYKTHQSDASLGELALRRWKWVILPPTCTPFIQPLDVCLIKPFRQRVREQYEQYVCDHMLAASESTSIDVSAEEHRNLVVQWISAAWSEIPASMVAKSFKVCGLSNALDGTEDDKVSVDIARPAWTDTV
jgi:hypothetical protein